jgi:hypothetical protein
VAGPVSTLVGTKPNATSYTAPGTAPISPTGEYPGFSSATAPGTAATTPPLNSPFGGPEIYGAPGTTYAGVAAAGGTGTGTSPVSSPAPAPSTSPATPTYGTQSGPGILQQWFGERANGTDPAYEYTTGRGIKALDNAAAARGGFNGGASMQQDSDYLANMGAQRQGQLDTLAAGASGENANQISQMLGMGMGLAGGQAGLAGGYDTGAATDWTNANNTGLSLSGQAAMIPYLARQQMMSQLMGGGMGILSSLL